MRRGILFASFTLATLVGVDHARAERTDIGGFQLSTPSGFVRGADEQQQENGINNEARANAGMGIIAARVFRRMTSEAKHETIVLTVLGGADVDPDDPSFVEGAKRSLAFQPGMTFDSTTVRTIGRGLRGPEMRMTMSGDGVSGRTYVMAIPRRGRVGSVTYVAVGMDAKIERAVWEEILRGVGSSLERPDPLASAGSGGSPAFRAGAILAYVLMGGGLVFGYTRIRARREANRREEAARRREEAALRRQRNEDTDRPRRPGPPPTGRPR